MMYLLLGLVIGIIISPFVDGLSDTIILWIEVLKMKPSRIISEWNKEMGKDEPAIDTYAIGFQAPNDEEYDDDDFDED